MLMRKQSDRKGKTAKIVLVLAIFDLLLLAVASWGYYSFADSVPLQAGRSSADSLIARVKGDHECSHQPTLDATVNAPSMELHRSGAEHEWLLHHTGANCVIIEAPLPYAPDQLLILHDDPLIYDWGQWDTFYYRLSEKGDHIVTITASGPGGTTVLEGPVETLVSQEN